MITAIVLAAGKGKRMEMDENKVFLKLGTKSILQHSVLAMAEKADEIVIVYGACEEEHVKAEVEALQLERIVRYALGGKERQDSVRSGLLASTGDIILVHDGARPLVSQAVINDVLRGVEKYGAAVPAIPVVDTIKRVHGNEVVETLVRSELYAMQTPQGFKRDVLIRAHEKALADGYMGTDDVSLVEYLGEIVHITQGDEKNIKVTHPKDVAIAKLHRGVTPMMQVGFGYDVHRFKEGRPCVLGGVHIDSPIGPDGHSDADVLIHALMDALLGAAGLKDIGYYFPPEDDAYKGIASTLLLEKVVQLLEGHHVRPHHVDVMVIAEQPKLKPHIDTMKSNLASILHIDPCHVSIKATTNEGLGALGRSEGIAAQAVATVYSGEEY